MKTRLFASLLFLLAATAVQAESFRLVVPVAANTPGANGTNWKSELTLHNVGRETIPVALSFHYSLGAISNATVSVSPRQRLSIDDVVGSKFGVSGVGAIEISIDQRFAGKLAVHSRSYNLTPKGSLGQDVPALPLSAALVSKDTGVLAGPSDQNSSRFNFGIYTLEPSTVRWSLIRQDGTEAVFTEVTYGTGTQAQYNRGVETLLHSDPKDNDTIHATVQSGSAFVYGSTIDQVNGDPTYIGGFRTRENEGVEFIGIDINDDGIVDIADADGNGVLDAPLTIGTGPFGSFFRVVVSDPEGASVSFSLAEPNRDVRFVDSNGRIGWSPSASLIGKSGVLKLLVNDGSDVTTLTIPVVFR